jgi:hypothetical protein
MSKRIELILYGGSGTTNNEVIGVIDLSDNLSLNLNYANSDIRDWSIRTSYSKTLNIPGNANNNTILKHIYQIGTTQNAFNQKKKVRCQVVEDGIPIFKNASFQLTKIHYEKGIINKYDCSLYDANDGLAKAIGDRYLNELSVSDLDHVYTSQTIMNSWTATTSYFYPLIDAGNDFEKSDIDGTVNQLKIINLFPATSANYLVNKIIHEAGATYSSPTYIDSTRFKRLYVPFNRTKIEFDKDFQEDHKVAVGLSGDSIFNWTGGTGVGSYMRFKIPFQDDSTVTRSMYDPGNRWDSTTYSYSANTFIRITANIRLAWYNHHSSQFGNQILLLINERTGLSIAGASVGGGFGLNQIYWDYNFALSNNGDLQPGDRIGVYLQVSYFGNNPAPGSPCVTFKYDVNDGVVVPSLPIMPTRFVIEPDTAIIAGQTIDYSKVLPKVKQIDYLKSICQIANCIVEPDADRDNNYNIIPRNDYYQSGQTLDWTLKVDTNNKVESSLISELISKELLFTYKKDSDFYSEDYYAKSEQEIFGQRKVINDNDWVKDQKKFELLFGSTPNILLPNSAEINLPKIGKLDSSSHWSKTESVIRLLSTAPNRVVTLTGETINFEGTKLNYYPYVGMVDHPDVSKQTFDLSFDAPRFLYYDISGVTLTNNNIYNLYWKNYVDDILSPDGRIFTFYLYLTAQDINELRFNNKIYIEYQGTGQLYYINKVIDYNPVFNKSTKVELIKVINLPSNTVSVSRSKPKETKKERPRVIGSMGLDYKDNVGHNGHLNINGEKNTVNNVSKFGFINGRNNEVGFTSPFHFISGEGNVINSFTSHSNIIGGNNNFVQSNTTGTTIIGSNNSAFFNFGAPISSSTIINLSNFTGSASNTVYMPYVQIMSGLTVNGVDVNMYWTAGTGANSLKRYPDKQNTAEQVHSLVTGGSGNTNASEFSTIINGRNNLIIESAFNFIGGGVLNSIVGSSYALIMNGKSNSLNLTNHSTIMGGKSSSMYLSNYSFIAGGKSNYISGNYSSILGGNNHSLTANNSAIIGGSGLTHTINNSVLLNNAFINVVNNGGNYMLTWNSTTKEVLRQSIPTGGSGSTNSVYIANGINTYTGFTAPFYTVNVTGLSINNLTTTGLTRFNSASASTFSASTYYSGTTPLQTILNSFSGGGLTYSGTNLGTGIKIYTGNTAQNNLAFRTLVSSGGTTVNQNGNTINIYSPPLPIGSDLWTSGDYLGGDVYSIKQKLGNNYISGAFNFVVGKENKTLNNTTYSNVNSGYYNIIRDHQYGSILNGHSNYLLGGFKSTILNGFQNYIKNGYYSSINNGYLNRLYGSAPHKHSTIINGFQNQIVASTANKYYNSIINGRQNIIKNGFHSTIIGGRSNYITGNYNCIIGGSGLSLINDNSVLVPYLHINNITSGGTYALTWNNSTKRVHFGSITGGGSSSSNINGINTFTAGTSTAQSINVTGLSISNISVTGNSSFNILSASTLYSGTTNLYSIFATIGSNSSGGGSNINGINTFTAGTFSAQSINITGGSFNQIISSGQSRFNSLSAQTFTADTANINTANINNANISSLTVDSAEIYNNLVVDFDLFVTGKIYSGTTDLYNIFVTSNKISSNINGINTFTGGTYALQSINVTGLSINNLTTSGATKFVSASATTFSASTYYSGTTNLYNIFPANGRNLNSTNRIYSGKSNGELLFRTLDSGTGIFLNESTSAVTITNTAPYPIRNFVCYNPADTGTELYLDSESYLVAFDSSTSSGTIFLPSSPFNGQEIIIKDRVGLASSNNIDVTDPNGYLIDNVTDFYINQNWQSVCFHFLSCPDTPQWIITRDYIAKP